MIRMLQLGLSMVYIAALGTQSFASPLTTPCGGTVGHGHITPELSLGEKNAIILWEGMYYPYAVRLAGPTNSYNCHSYAFSGAHGWVNDPGVYIDSYEVDWDTGDRMTYFNCITGGPSHSAIDLPSLNMIAVSKWGQASLMQHGWNYVPTEYAMYQGFYKQTSGCSTNTDCM